MAKDYEPIIVYLKHSDKPFLELRDVAAFTGTQHGNMRSLIDSYIEREILTLKNAQPMVYWGKGDREVDSYHLDAYALGILAETAVSFSSKNRRDQIDHLIEYLHLEEHAADDLEFMDKPEPEIAVEVPQTIVNDEPDAEPRPIQVVETVTSQQPVRPVVKVIDGVVMADSRDVAAFFKREHRNVLRDIRSLLNFEHTPKDWFQPLQTGATNGQLYPSFLMNQDGFSLLVMGFTGEDAIRFKVDYIQTFRDMEAQLKSDSLEEVIKNPLKSLTFIQGLVTQLAANQDLIDAQKREITVRDDVITEMQPKADAIDRMSKLNGARQIRVVAQAHHIKQTTLVKWMLERKWVVRDPGNRNELMAAHKGINGGYVIPYSFKFYNPKTAQDEISTRPRITPKGEQFIALNVTPDHPAYLKGGGTNQGSLAL